jgi:hypothetical protein
MKRHTDPISIEKNPHNGSLILSTMVKGHLFHRQYFFYSRKDALIDFKRKIRQERLKK